MAAFVADGIDLELIFMSNIFCVPSSGRENFTIY